jgi:uncharacterized membrane protein
VKLPAGKTSRLFIVSLVLNVFLIGAVTGGAYRWARGGPASVATEPSQSQGLRAAAAELPEDRQKQLRETLQRTRQMNRPLILGARAGRLDVLQALQAQPFDPAALDAALARTRLADSALRSQLEQSIVQFASTLTPAERSKLIDGMEHRGLLRRIDADRK